MSLPPRKRKGEDGKSSREPNNLKLFSFSASPSLAVALKPIFLPGIFFVLPCIESYQKVDLRTITLGVPPQEVSEGCSTAKGTFAKGKRETVGRLAGEK